MSPEDYKIRYEALLRKVARMRGYQVNYERVRTESNKKSMQRVVNELDNFLKVEEKRLQSPQLEIQ